MIEQPALVAAVRRPTVWVRSCSAGNCQACAVGQGCGAGWLLRCFARRDREPLALEHAGSFAPGDRVVLSVPERWLVAVAGAVYGLPLLGLIMGATLGDTLGRDTGAMLLGGGGFLAGTVLAAALSTRLGKACPLSVRAAPRGTQPSR